MHLLVPTVWTSGGDRVELMLFILLPGMALGADRGIISQEAEEDG